MTEPEFRTWLQQLVANGHMTELQMNDLLAQKALFNLRFGEREDHPQRQNYDHRIVGYVADEFLESPDIHALLDRAANIYPGRMLYFEPIGFDLY